MPIDPSIVSALAPQAGATSTLAGQASMMNAYEAQRKAQEERRRQQEIQSILSSATDPVMGADLLTKRGYLDEAGKVLEQHDKHRKSLADLLDSDNKRDLFELDVLGRAVRDVKDQNSLEYAKKIAAAFGADGQKIGALLPETYDPAMTPAQVSALMDANLSAVEASNKTAKAIEALRDGKWRTGLAEALSVADSPDDWKNARETFRQAGMPQSELAQFPEEFSPENKVIAGNKALSEKDRRDLASKDAAAQASAANTAADNARADAALGVSRERLNLARQNAARAAQGGATGAAGSDDVKVVADAIISGQQPPSMTGMYRNTLALKAELARRGYDLTRATEDWTATQKYLNTLNGAQQTRLRQAVNFTKESIPLIRELVTKWDSSGLPLLSKANLEAAASGAYGQTQQSLARRLKGQIADLTSELGTVYKGGNSSTDESLKLAAENLQADWSKKAALDALTQIEKNLQFRENSIKNVGPIGGRDNNPYAPQVGGAIPEGTERPVPGHPGVVAVYRGGRWIVK